jgi:hypothetical protein
MLCRFVHYPAGKVVTKKPDSGWVTFVDYFQGWLDHNNTVGPANALPLIVCKVRARYAACCMSLVDCFWGVNRRQDHSFHPQHNTARVMVSYF